MLSVNSRGYSSRFMNGKKSVFGRKKKYSLKGIMKGMLISMLIIMGLSINVVNSDMRIQINQYTKSIAQMDKERTELKVQVAALTSPTRIQDEARLMGMNFPEDGQIKYVKQGESMLEGSVAFKFNDDTKQH